MFVHVNGLCYMILRAICGILLSLSLCDFIMKHLPRLEETMARFSNKTYTIYLLSWFGHYIMKFALVKCVGYALFDSGDRDVCWRTFVSVDSLPVSGQRAVVE